MMWGYGWNMGWSWLLGLLLLVGVVLLIVVLVRMFAGGASTSGPAAMPTAPDRSRQILDERFAKGELTSEQYREQIQVLGEHRP